jgi:hypothetical protein
MRPCPNAMVVKLVVVSAAVKPLFLTLTHSTPALLSR